MSSLQKMAKILVQDVPVTMMSPNMLSAKSALSPGEPCQHEGHGCFDICGLFLAADRTCALARSVLG